MEKNKLDGIILIDKEKDYTSNDICQIVKKNLHVKVGHIGTLDPNATGLIPLLIGEGTKLSKYLIEHDKEYIATIKLGIKTDTLDITGNVLEEKNENEISKYNEAVIISILESFQGEITQIPPIYSAIKVNGKKLYEYAREGKEDKVEIPERKITIYDIELLKYDSSLNEIKFKVSCSKGTYIRTLVNDICEKLNEIGTLKDLRRTKVGYFDINDSIKIDEIKNCNNLDEIKVFSIKDITENVLKFNKIIINNEKDLNKLLNGVIIDINQENINSKEIEYVSIYYNDEFIGIGTFKHNKLKRDLIING